MGARYTPREGGCGILPSAPHSAFADAKPNFRRERLDEELANENRAPNSARRTPNSAYKGRGSARDRAPSSARRSSMSAAGSMIAGTPRNRTPYTKPDTDRSVRLFRSYCHDEQQGLRPTMEDGYRAVRSFAENTAFFAVYDGHGGREAVDVIENTLERNLAIQLKKHDGNTIEEKIIRAYKVTDRDLCSGRHGIGEPVPIDVGQAGSTAVTVLVKKEGQNRTLYAANCGDARAVLSYNGKARRLTKDHKPDDPEENRRIERAGGFVQQHRVHGILAVARAFGDKGLKKYVPADPYTSSFEITQHGNGNSNGNSDPFMIVACDGLWDVMSDQEAVELVRDLPSRSQDSAARMLTQEALNKGSTDNVTCLVVFL